MAEKFYKTEKFQQIFYAVLYFLLAVAFVCTGVFVFKSQYYTNIYVSGSSMMPTLIGNTSNRVHYGISDKHQTALRNLDRFDVVITYYPWNIPEGETDEVYKIKRVWGFPGETISMVYNEAESNFTYTVTEGELLKYKIVAPIVDKDVNGVTWKVCEFKTEKKTFYTALHEYRQFNVTLDRDNKEYFLMGDNWGNSTDSYSHNKPGEKRITYGDLQGKVIMIQGTAKVDGENLYDKKKITPMYYF